VKSECNVLIVGAGPAGMFAANELARRGVSDVLMIDSGYPAMDRSCPLTSACNCTPCDILEGVGGSGGVSDGKLTFSLDRGTQLEPVFQPHHAELLGYVDQIMVDHGVEGVRYNPEDNQIPDGFSDNVPIVFHTYPLWHIGSDGIQEFSQSFHETLSGLGVSIQHRSRALKLLRGDGRIEGAVVRWNVGPGQYQDAEIRANHVILAVGIYGIGWLEEELTLMGLSFGSGPAGIGLRIETPNRVLAPLFNAFYDWKLVGTFSGLTMRSFCCNRDGYIMPELHRHLGIRNVNGHSYRDPSKKSQSSNFSLQAKITTEDHPDPQAFVRAVARDMNALSGGWQVRQTVSEFLGGQRQGEEDTVTYPQARIADVAKAFPPQLYRSFSEYLTELDSLIPGIVSSGWVYGPEIKYHARKLPINRDDWSLGGMENTYVIGDSTGLTGSYVSAALTGILAAQGIASKEN